MQDALAELRDDAIDAGFAMRERRVILLSQAIQKQWELYQISLIPDDKGVVSFVGASAAFNALLKGLTKMDDFTTIASSQVSEEIVVKEIDHTASINDMLARYLISKGVTVSPHLLPPGMQPPESIIFE